MLPFEDVFSNVLPMFFCGVYVLALISVSGKMGKTVRVSPEEHALSSMVG
jgi:hypothetical protein